MRKIIIHYFTGTGNTAHAAEIMKSELEKHDFDVKLIKILKGMTPPEGFYDCHIILFPVFALSIPYALGRYLKKMPAGKGSKAVIIANHGMISLDGGMNSGYESQAPLVPARILNRRGYRIVLTGAVGYPENITIIAKALEKEKIDLIIENGDRLIINYAQNIIKGEILIKKYNILDKTAGWFFGFLYSYFGRYQIGKLYIAGKACNRCGICVRTCPAGAIRIFNNKPRWNFRCEGCLGCFNLCPHTAVQVSIVRLAVLLFFNIWPVVFVVQNYSKIISAISGSTGPGFANLLTGNIFPVITLGIVFYLVIALTGISISDKILFILEQIPFTRKVLEWTYTRRFDRYIMPGYDPLKNIK